MSTVIKVENLSKQYRLGKVGTGTLSHDLNRWWHSVRGKEDPYLKVGQVNDRTARNGTNDYVWALRNITFEVKQGEVLGVIGRNGAGKSTLLKILSRTTLPTSGSVKVKGRIASLLEVGTGFHPELTGKENVFLNGAILGMRKYEIKKKFDQIVDFAGVEKYIDTPVKRYSSGMYVRLAFAVAAHLDPEILIVDEVLAVGDAEFQRKCLGKMKDVSANEGRTVLFVSHNMASIQKLCNTVTLLSKGEVYATGDSERIIQLYLKEGQDSSYSKNGIGGISVHELSIVNSRGERVDSVNSFEQFSIEITVKADHRYEEVSFAIGFNDMNGVRVLSLWTKFMAGQLSLDAGYHKVVFQVENFKLTPGEYSLTTYADSRGIELERIDHFGDVIVSFRKGNGYLFEPKASQGLYMENFSFKVTKL